MPMTTSAALASALAKTEPLAPSASTICGWSYGRLALPAWVTPTGMPVDAAKAASASLAAE